MGAVPDEAKGDSMKHYSLFLPVFKQGDDLAYHLNKNPDDNAKAFIGLAEQYEEAAKQCRRVAGVLAETEAEVGADCHFIGVSGDEQALAGLVADNLLQLEPDQDDEYSDEEDDGEIENEDLD